MPLSHSSEQKRALGFHESAALGAGTGPKARAPVNYSYLYMDLHASCHNMLVSCRNRRNLTISRKRRTFRSKQRACQRGPPRRGTTRSHESRYSHEYENGLRAARVGKNLTRQQLSTRCLAFQEKDDERYVTVSISTIKQLELGGHKPRLKNSRHSGRRSSTQRSE